MRLDPVTALGIGLQRDPPHGGEPFRAWLFEDDRGSLNEDAVVEFIDALYIGWSRRLRWIDAGQALVDLSQYDDMLPLVMARRLRKTYARKDGQYWNRIEGQRHHAMTVAINPWARR